MGQLTTSSEPLPWTAGCRTPATETNPGSGLPDLLLASVTLAVPVSCATAQGEVCERPQALELRRCVLHEIAPVMWSVGSRRADGSRVRKSSLQLSPGRGVRLRE